VPWAAAAAILVAAGIMGWLFNAFAPQGVGLAPDYVEHPLWRPASAERVHALWREGAQLVDARDPGSYKEGHLRGAVNLPPREWDLMFPLLEPELRKAGRVVVYGRTTSRFPAAHTAQKLRRQGLEDVWATGAGLEELSGAGLGVRQGRGGGS
jgi:rhodanese-related sulfurtransferase